MAERMRAEGEALTRSASTQYLIKIGRREGVISIGRIGGVPEEMAPGDTSVGSTMT